MSGVTEYEMARNRYWDAQREFRRVAVNEIAHRIPEGMSTAVFEINDADPSRMALLHYQREGDGQPIQDDQDSTWDAIDQMAADMELFDWNEASSLLEHDDLGRFFIGRVQ